MKSARLLLAVVAFAAPALAQMRIIPHLTSPTGGFATGFILANPLGTSQDIRLMPFMVDGTAQAPFSVTLEPHETRFLTAAELFPEAGASHVVIAEQGEARITVAYQDAAGANSAAHIAVADTQAVRWRIYPGTLDDVLDGIAVVNVDDQTRDVLVRQVDHEGVEVGRVIIASLAAKGKGLYLFDDFQKRADAYFEIFADGPLALTALRFSAVDGARFFWETAAAPLPALAETGNEPPVITGQVDLSVTAGEPLTIELSHLTVADPDNDFPADFSLTVADGANYSRDGAVITPDAEFAGALTVPVSVNDGVNDSETYQLQVTVLAAGDPRVGRVAMLRENSTYGISGRAVIASENLIRLEQFTYSGGGPDVRVYLGVDDSFANGIVISGTISGTPYQNATLEFPLPEGVTLDDFNSISIWCVVFSISFSEGVFE